MGLDRLAEFLREQAERLEALAHNTGPSLKTVYRMELLTLAARSKMAAQQLPHLDFWEALNAQS